MTNFINRRTQLAQKIKGGVAIVFSNTLQTRSNDTEFSFRQNSQFFYLTGFHEVDSILVITTEPEIKSILFVLPKDPAVELWTGKRTGKEDAKKLGVDLVFEINQFETELPKLLANHHNVLYDLFHSEDKNKTLIIKTMNALNTQKKSTTRSPSTTIDLKSIIGQMRLIKDSEEIECMKKAAALSTLAHHAAMNFTGPSKNEYEISALLEFIVKKNGAKSMAYESIVAGGNNANILHYINNDQELKEGDLLLIDAGAEYNNYASDVTRTFPVNGKFTDNQKKIYQIVLKAQKECIKAAVVGNTQKAIDKLARTIMTKELMNMEILKDHTLEEHLEKNSIRTFYPHGTGHWLGLDVHDECPYQDALTMEDIKLLPGMVITVEPGLYFDAENINTPEMFKGIGIRIEDDILITKNGPINLSESIAKEIEDIEKQCSLSFKLH